ncbi:DUF4147 domain-containing protein [uncultured Roseobacter sp.]|uniref:DUF4147 domain-containing protein n=1 Tax=uncultured Roseobacter sp. TaxID=114847 RepID=UPI002614E97F|nr:DUF4147 domain-containing protein [uncultured Roseobacter sp.]
MHTADLEELFWAGVNAVRGDNAVRAALAARVCRQPDQIIAVGKAASAMARAAHEAFPGAPVLIVTKYRHTEGAPAGAEVRQAAHPVLDENSLAAGARLLDVVSGMNPDSHLLILVSGGASALAEAPVDGLDLAGLTARAQEMLASGADIHAMNAARTAVSRVKGGKLLGQFKGASVTTLAISDVEGDSLAVIGSGIGDAPERRDFAFDARIVASNAIARTAVAEAARRTGLPVATNDETLYDDIMALAPRIGAALRAAQPGVHIFGGEPTVVLPPNPGRGGRNQALALMLAREIQGQNGLRLLVAGTDGTDGPTDAAGAVVDGSTWDDTAQDALARADAGRWLDAHGALLKTGPTGTNVMDLVIGLRD